jgi:hypothetical protein
MACSARRVLGRSCSSSHRGTYLTVSPMYVDDVVLFFSPSLQDLQLTTTIFDLFKSSSGLCCNVGKCQIVLLRCDEAQIQLAHEQFPCPIKECPIQYLGMPMSTGKLPKSTLQPLADRMVDRPGKDGLCTEAFVSRSSK